MSHFIKSGNDYLVAPDAAIDIHKKLPVATYVVKYNEMKDMFYLSMIEDFVIASKVYGDTPKTSERILNTFDDRPNSTGVMLSGEKGSGKTLLAKLLSLDGQKRGYPTIVINQPHRGDGFNAFMQTIEQPAVILFDEFEKVYSREEQEQMLTLLDGVYPSRKLFVITCNDKYRVNEHMKNRPGRIFYHIAYHGLENNFIIEYCQDNLNDKSHIDDVCRVALMFSEFNFDILKAMVEEMNRYQESPIEVLKLLNAKPESDEGTKYVARLRVGGVDVPERAMHDSGNWQGNPLAGTRRNMYGDEEDLSVSYKSGPYSDKDTAETYKKLPWQNVKFESSDLVEVDTDTGQFKFVNDNGDELMLVKQPKTTYNWNVFRG